MQVRSAGIDGFSSGDISAALPDVSLIVPAFNEGTNIQPFYEATVSAFGAGEVECKYEIVFVDDGSSDDTFARMIEIESLRDRPCEITIVSFSRNFGKESAMYAGLEHAQGKVVGFIDADLQQRPEQFVEMYRLLLESPEYDCVAAYQEERRGSFVRSKLSHCFYGVLSKSSNMSVLTDASDFRVFHRYVAQALLSMEERLRFSKGLFTWIGFKTLPFAYTPETRYSGQTSWSMFKLVKYAFGGLLSFSTVPLTIATYFGVASSIVAIIYLIVVVVQRLAFGVDVPGYATVVALQLLFGGMILLALGIIGSYIARIYIEGKRRPIYIAKYVTGSALRGCGCEDVGHGKTA